VCPVCGRPGAVAEVRCPHDGASLVVLEGSLEARETDLLGQVVDGRYRVESVIGRGGMGVVFAARHIVVGRRVALKVLKPSLEHSEDTLARFVREAQAANAVRSPYILRADDFGQLGSGAFYVVMDLLEGSPLGDALRERRLHQDSLLDVFTQVAEGLGAAHAAGIVHRDLKPDNVFLVESAAGPQVRILDFGVAKLMHQGTQGLTETGVILGTPHYMSPEQARGYAIDHRSDIYALGVVMFQAFTGRLPFISDSAVGVLTAHAVEEPPRPSLSGVDVALEAIILRCMQKRPDDRFATMFEVSAALQQRRGRPVVGQPSMIAEPSRSPTDKGMPHAIAAPAFPAAISHPASHTGPQSGSFSGPQSGSFSGPQSGSFSGPQSGPASGPQSGSFSGPQSGPYAGRATAVPQIDTSTNMSAIAMRPVSRGLYLALGAGMAIVGVVGALLVAGPGRFRGDAGDAPATDRSAAHAAPAVSTMPGRPTPQTTAAPAESSAAAASPSASAAAPNAASSGPSLPTTPGPSSPPAGRPPVSSRPPPPARPPAGPSAATPDPVSKPPAKPRDIRSPFD